jgi:signal transduction histidine kinase
MIEDEGLERARLLVIDDEEANIRLLERILAASGFADVIGSSDPREARALVETNDPDLLLLDLLMPHVDGFEVMQGLRDTLPPDRYFPILVLTADATEGTKRRALAAGANDFLTKPFDATEVVLRIRNLLRTRFLHVELQRQNDDLEERVRARTEELSRTGDQLRATDTSRRALLSRLVRAQEEERQRIAADVHDDSVQIMTAVAMRLHLVRQKLTDPNEFAAMEKLELSVQEAIGRLRQLLFELRPPSLDRDGLASAIAEYGQQRLEGDLIIFRIDNSLANEPPLEARTILYRVAQEAINNVKKHANARTVSVLLADRDGGIELIVRDDGVGFDTARGGQPVTGHLGILSMSERAEMAGGTVEIESGTCIGTTLRCWLPIDAGGMMLARSLRPA